MEGVRVGWVGVGVRVEEGIQLEVTIGLLQLVGVLWGSRVGLGGVGWGWVGLGGVGWGWVGLGGVGWVRIKSDGEGWSRVGLHRVAV